MRVALTIAGSDSGGGAGIQADLKTFHAHGVFGTSTITSVTAQNTRGVTGVWDLPPEAVRAQFRAVVEDFDVAAIKIGMLSGVAIVETVADLLEELAEGIPVVLDPVIAASSGDRLLRDNALRVLTDRLLPLATVVTPNAAETEALCGYPVPDRRAVENAAQRIHSFGAANVLVTGGDRREYDPEGKPISADLLFDGDSFRVFAAEFVESRNTHGTGCTLSSAIAANLANGIDLQESIGNAKNYVTEAIRNAPGLGKGHGPLKH